jgi:hypothetical protein
MTYKKKRLPPLSRRSPLDENPRALNMRLAHSGFYIPMGMRSKNRFRRILRPTPTLLTRINNPAIHHLLSPENSRPLRSIYMTHFPSFCQLARRRGFTIYVDGIAITNLQNDEYIEK